MTSRKRRVVRSACRMCHGVCQVLVHLEGDRVVGIKGDPESPTSRGYLCPKGAASAELLYHPDRLTRPLKRAGERGENRWRPVSWDRALDEMAARLKAIKEESGPEYFSLMQGTGRPYSGFTARFANAFGSPNVTEILHFCYLARQQAGRYSAGQMPVCDVYGFGGAKPRCLVLWGCNITHSGAADGMCGGMVARAIRGAEKVIVVDPRRIGPAEKADHWLQLRPGTDGALALAMIRVIIDEGLYDRGFVENYTLGFEALAEHVQGFTPDWAAGITRLEPELIVAAARTYARTGPACIQWGNALDMSRSAFQTARAVLFLSALTGNLDRPGGDALWLAPDPARRKSPWHNPEVAGGAFLPPEKAARKIDGERFPLLHSVQPPAFFRSINTGRPYRVRALWIMGANPLLTISHSLEVERALKRIEYLVVSDLFMTPTAQQADLVLPAASWLETDDVVSLHKVWCVLARQKVAQIGQTRNDREVFIQLAHRLGLEEAFPWKDYRDYLDWTLEGTGLTFEEFCEQGIIAAPQRYFKYREEGFKTESGRFEFHSKRLADLGVEPLPVYREPSISPISTPELAREYPLILTAMGRAKGYFHSEGRQIDSLRRRNPDPLVQLHPQTAAGLGIGQGDWIWLETKEGRIRMRADLFDGLAPDVVAAQHAWWFPEEGPPEYGWKRSSLNLLLGDMEDDPDIGAQSVRSVLARVCPVREE